MYSLREYYNELFEDLLTSQGGKKELEDSRLREELPPATSLQRPAYDLEDVWALRYLNSTSLRELIEALDTDASSLITVKEMNEFTRARPDGWR